MPLLPNSKVDRRALPQPVRQAPSTTIAVGPRSELEEIIAGIWRKLLEIDHIDRDENFFDAGGHSLQIVRLRSELRNAVGRDVTVLELFTHSTIRSLASLLGDGHKDTFSISDINQRARSRREYYSSIQREVQRRSES